MDSLTDQHFQNAVQLLFRDWRKGANILKDVSNTAMLSALNTVVKWADKCIPYLFNSPENCGGLQLLTLTPPPFYLTTPFFSIWRALHHHLTLTAGTRRGEINRQHQKSQRGQLEGFIGVWWGHLVFGEPTHLSRLIHIIHIDRGVMCLILSLHV